MVIYGALLSRQELAGRYLSLIRNEIDAKVEAAEPGEAPPSASPAESQRSQVDDAGADTAADNSSSGATANPTPPAQSNDADEVSAQQNTNWELVPLRRMMQLGNRSERVIYPVAVAMIRQGRVAMAVQMLREIAPVTGGGFPAAHALLAEYTLAGWKGEPTQMQSMLADLETAEQSGMRLSAQVLQAYAELLKFKNRTPEAVRVLREHVDEYPELAVVLAQMDRVEGSAGNNAREAMADVRADFERKREAGDAKLSDVELVVRLELLDGNMDRALTLAQYGFGLDQADPAARRLYSSVLFLKHRKVIEDWQFEKKRAEALRRPMPPLDLRYLELGVQIDSANPAAGEELAKIMSFGQGLAPELRETLERSLLDGTATGVTHLILANGKLMGDQPQSALPQLRLALRKMPDSPVVMNNLAYAILKYEPTNLPEARKLIERALSIPGSSASDMASMFDTLAEIRLAEDDSLGAIQCFEEAIRRDGSKLSTRRKLAELYQREGMQELSRGQLRIVEEMSQAASPTQ